MDALRFFGGRIQFAQLEAAQRRLEMGTYDRCEGCG